MKEKIIEFIKKKVKEANAKGVVIGLSGGLDSTTVLFLCVEALGKDRVLGAMMPLEINKKEDLEDAIQVCEKLGVKYKIIKIDPILKSFEKFLDLRDKLVKGNLVARIRMCILYYFANKEKSLVVGTGNKSEYLQGYFTLHGDIACDFLPIGNLYKKDVKELAKELGIPEKIIEKTPSAGLWPNQTDEGELGITYEELDKILPLLEEKMSVEEIHDRTNIKTKKIIKVKERMEKTEFKRKPIEKP
ncbi:MAG: NAD+ synthase [Candidatus Aenigmarchaeota archaeon]|nr:NAD+ synthase [Candidatus Aenigmarchaeota archaeon]